MVINATIIKLVNHVPDNVSDSNSDATIACDDGWQTKAHNLILISVSRLGLDQKKAIQKVNLNVFNHKEDTN